MVEDDMVRDLYMKTCYWSWIVSMILTYIFTKSFNTILNLFWAMLEDLPIYGNLKKLVSVFTSVLISNSFLSNFKFRNCFVTCFVTLPCVADFESFSIEGVKLKNLVNKPVYIGLLYTDATRSGLLHTKTSIKWVRCLLQFPWWTLYDCSFDTIV